VTSRRRISLRRWLIVLVATLFPCSGGFAEPATECPDGGDGATIHIAALGTGGGSGTVDDPYDGLGLRLDRLLRQRSERGVESLLVCIGPGTYPTEGVMDYAMYRGHLSSTPGGFTIGKSWRVIGAGVGSTTLRLVNLYMPQPANEGFVDTQTNRVFTSRTDAVEGIEIAHLTIDLNYQEMKELARSRGYPGVSLEAIYIRSSRGRNWIHDVHVVNLAGEYGENFPVSLWSLKGFPGPSGTGAGGVPGRDNVIERVRVSGWFGGATTAISIVNSTGVIQDCVVDFRGGVNAPAAGFTIAFTGHYNGNGGDIDPAIIIRRNTVLGADYGTNNDTWRTERILIEDNVFDTRRYGSVVGGGYPFSSMMVRNNVIRLPATGIGVVFQGRVRDSLVSGNTITIAAPRPALPAMRTSAGNTGNTSSGNVVCWSDCSCPCPGCGRGGAAVEFRGKGNDGNTVMGNTVRYTGVGCDCADVSRRERNSEAP
jgi:hypothetical protein